MLYIAVYLRCIPSSIVTFLDALYGFECKVRRTNILIISIVIIKGKVNGWGSATNHSHDFEMPCGPLMIIPANFHRQANECVG